MRLKDSLTAAVLCGPQLSQTTSARPVRRFVHGPSCVSTHMTMPAESIHALCCEVTTTSVVVLMMYGRLKTVLVVCGRHREREEERE